MSDVWAQFTAGTEWWHFVLMVPVLYVFSLMWRLAGSENRRLEASRQRLNRNGRA